MHLVAQVRRANGLRGIFRFSEILGSPTYLEEHFLEQGFIEISTETFNICDWPVDNNLEDYGSRC
jgi:hypothetical protein